MPQLDSSVRLIALQFSFSNRAVLPKSAIRRPRETAEQSAARKSRGSGSFTLIEPTTRCSLAGFLDGLEAAGYEMVDATYQERVDHNQNGGKKEYFTVRYMFARHEAATPSEFFIGVRDANRAELRSLAEQSLWRVRCFANPVFEEGEATSGQCALSINMEVREPRFNADGSPRTEWKKDSEGNKLGTAPLPIRAEKCLMFVGDLFGLFAND